MWKPCGRGLLLTAVLLAGCASPPPVEHGASRERPADQEVKYHYALEAMKQGHAEEAETLLTQLTREHPELAGPWVNLCIIYTAQERLGEAEKACQRALRNNDRLNAARNQLGIVYRKQGRFQDARRIYQMALQQDPRDAQVCYNLGVLFDLYLQDNELAIQYYQRYLELTGNRDKKVKRWIAQLNKELNKSR